MSDDVLSNKANYIKGVAQSALKSMVIHIITTFVFLTIINRWTIGFILLAFIVGLLVTTSISLYNSSLPINELPQYMMLLLITYGLVLITYPLQVLALLGSFIFMALRINLK